MISYSQIQLRRGSAAEWTEANPTLLSGEPGYETDTRFLKIGDGSTPWVTLPYYQQGSGIFDVRNYSSINAAIAAIGSTQGTILVSTAQTLTDDLIVPSTLSLVIPKGGSIAKASNHTLTINGPLEAGDYPVFSGFNNGDVTFGPGAVKEVPIMWFLPADYVADGSIDYSTQIQTAATAAATAGKPLLIPAGKWQIAGQVVMPVGLKIYGYSKHGTIIPGTGLATLTNGSVIYCTGTTLAPFLYTSGNHFEGLTFYYPNQLRTAETPTVYPATFLHATVGSEDPPMVNVSWRDCQFVNSYKWIDALVGHLDFEFTNLVGCPISIGIEIDGSGGTDRLSNIHQSWYYWCQAGDAAATWIQAHSLGIRVGRADAIEMDRIFTANLNYGMQFFYGSVNTASGPYGYLSSYSSDGCNVGIFVEATHPIGMALSNPMINAKIAGIWAYSASSYPVNLSITGGKFWGAVERQIRMASDGILRVSNVEFWDSTVFHTTVDVAACDISLANCKFEAGVAPLYSDGVICNTLMLSNNEFGQAPVLNATPATIYRYRGNTYLADAAGGG
jgi:hypothetical protein